MSQTIADLYQGHRPASQQAISDGFLLNQTPDYIGISPTNVVGICIHGVVLKAAPRLGLWQEVKIRPKSHSDIAI